MSDISALMAQPNVSSALDWLSGQQDALLGRLQDWAHINSGSTNAEGLTRMAEAVSAFAGDMAVDIARVDLAPTERVGKDGQPYEEDNVPALHIKSRSRGNRRVLLTGHLDTVFPPDSAFQTCRFQEGGTLNGPGVADMKGGILVMLSALKALERSGLADRISYDVLLSPDEETGSLASAEVLTRMARDADIGLTYEPALPDGTLAGRRKGSGNFTLVVHGKAAHAGREFFEGRNAVVKLAAIIGDLAALTGGRPGLTLNAATLAGGQAPNIVPDLAQCRFNVRLEEQSDGDWVVAAIDDILARHGEDGFSIKLYGGINRPPKVISTANQMLMDKVRALGSALDLAIDYVPTGGCCEGNNLAAAGLPNIDTLGVRGGLIHSAQEFMVPESLIERARLSALILCALAEGQFDDVVDARRREEE